MRTSGIVIPRPKLLERCCGFSGWSYLLVCEPEPRDLARCRDPDVALREYVLNEPLERHHPSRSALGLRVHEEDEAVTLPVNPLERLQQHLQVLVRGPYPALVL